MQRYKTTEYTIYLKKREKIEQLHEKKHGKRYHPLADKN